MADCDDYVPPSYDGYIGYGLIDAAAAYEDLTGEDIYEEDDFEEDLEPEELTGPTNNKQSMSRKSN